MVGGIIAAVTRVTVAAPRCEVERRAMDASRTRFIPDRLLGLFELTTWPSDGGGHRGACCEPGAAHRRRRSYARGMWRWGYPLGGLDDRNKSAQGPPGGLTSQRSSQ